jgi:hypothetical protein
MSPRSREKFVTAHRSESATSLARVARRVSLASNCARSTSNGDDGVSSPIVNLLPRLVTKFQNTTLKRKAIKRRRPRSENGHSCIKIEVPPALQIRGLPIASPWPSLSNLL